jgi:hypothetical protein
MALYGSQRDVSLLRHINRELIGDIISQECAYYKFKIEETNVNLYGEAAGAKYYYPPVLLNCLIYHQPQSSPDYEVDDVIDNQLFVGKDPRYTYGGDNNPINPGLENFGRDLSIICKTHYQPADKVQLEKARING